MRTPDSASSKIPVEIPRKARLGFLENPGWPMVEIGNSAMKHACERAQVICVPITMRSAIPRPHLASQGWHCQGFLASHAASPLSVGSARDYWRGAGPRHSGLALPGISGMRRFLASHFWHCQGLLAQGGFPPPSSGTARISGQKPLRIGSARFFWRGAGPRHSALALPGFRGAGRVLSSPPHTSF